MKQFLLTGITLLTSLFSACNYDPFYYGSSTASYGVSGFGNGYSTSFFVSTGDPRWAYDPYRYCYFDRHRSCYYDPFLYGYYPMGYCPVPVRGCPHPYNWSGVGICPPPRTIRHNTLSRYDNRISNYHAANYHWARKVSSSGSSSWLGSQERTQLFQRASQSTTPSPSASSPSWMNGGLRRDSSLHEFPQSTFPSAQGLPTKSWSGSSRQNNSAPTLGSKTRETPDIQLRPTTGGMFGGLNRHGSGSSPALRGSSMPQIESSRSSEKVPQRSQSLDEDSSSAPNNSTGGGLRRFQR